LNASLIISFQKRLAIRRPHASISSEGSKHPKEPYRHLSDSRDQNKLKMAQSYEEVLQSLTEAQQSHELSIIKISEPISAAINQSFTRRTSDVSADAFESPSPASLEADLSHYKVR
jgi:hypothetical protein